MALLGRHVWYDIARDLNWTPRYVAEDELFPEALSGGRDLTLEQWARFDEPYKVTYPEYVAVQRQKDSDAYSVKAALARARFLDQAPPGWQGTLILHYGAIALAEYEAGVTGEARMARFSKAPGNRNMATFGMLDETRHAQIQLAFPHEHTQRGRQWDWAWKTYHTNQWAAIAARHFFDDTVNTRDAITLAIMLTFAFETGFTNMQFLGLAADAAEAGDHTFASLISSVQTDEARHAQQGGPIVKLLVEHGRKADAQRAIDIAFWRAWRLFAILTGPAMDYATPVEARQQSFKEFMLEWIVSQFERNLLDLGLDKPWYWDEFMRALDETHHAFQIGLFYWRSTLWWPIRAGVLPDERDWLEEKYPGWNDTFGRVWDVMIERMLAGDFKAMDPETLPILDNMSNLPIVGTPGNGWNVRDYPLEYKGRLYHFGSKVDRWIFEQEPERYAGHMTLVDRFLAGLVQPANLEGAFAYMDIAPGERGDDAENFTWLDVYRRLARKTAS